jgi:hypothetical protein
MYTAQVIAGPLTLSGNGLDAETRQAGPQHCADMVQGAAEERQDKRSWVARQSEVCGKHDTIADGVGQPGVAFLLPSPPDVHRLWFSDACEESVHCTPPVIGHQEEGVAERQASVILHIALTYDGQMATTMMATREKFTIGFNGEEGARPPLDGKPLVHDALAINEQTTDTTATVFWTRLLHIGPLFLLLLERLIGRS